MKTLVQKVRSLVWILLVGLWLLPNDSQAQQAEVSFQVFYDELAPYGRWLTHPKYGDVWAPNVDGEFTPYLTNGYWTVTQYGNTWVSNYDWGWATFHYGRWFFDEFDGWVWIPDTVWAPAWVVWRNGGGYYGWAAMSPGYNFSVSFNLFNNIPNNYWCFVPQQYVWRPFVYRYCAPRHRNVYIVNNTTYVTHYTVNSITYNYYTGPSHAEITHITNRPVVIHNVEQGNRPGRTQVDHDKITMYKPIVNGGENNRSRFEHLTNGNSNNSVSNDWHRPSKGQSSGGNHNNNGYGNGDQNAPGNSGDHNNGENSDNNGKGNGGNESGSRWGSLNTDRSTSQQNWTNNNTRTENSHRTTEFRKPSNFGSNNNNRTTSGGRSRSGSSGNTRSFTPGRSSSSGGGSKSFTPSHSGGGNGRSFTPNRSGGGTITPSHSGGGTKSFSPSHSSGLKPRSKN